MPELRQNFVTKEWVIIATERAKRPEEMVVHRPIKATPAYMANCPFCPGNEAQTPPEVLRLTGTNGDSWQARVVPNKFAALSRDEEPERTIYRTQRTINGFGVHEIIIETPDHSKLMALMSDAQVSDVLRIYKARYADLSLDPRIAQITIFKNHGMDAGTSLEHPHSQLIATPVISLQVRHRFQEALRHYDDFGTCIFCQVLEEELGEQKRIVLATEHFVAFELFASPAPFSTHIYPRRHMASFGDISELEIADLGRALRTVLAKLYQGLKNPDFNFTIRTAPRGMCRGEIFSLVSQRDSPSDSGGWVRTRFGNVHQHCLARGSGRVSAERESSRSSSTACLINSLRLSCREVASPGSHQSLGGNSPLPNAYSFNGPKRFFSE
ncbi:MAG TPA: galactose-1-phosphate uridylyltransferase [Terriglobales bacterium]|nr:galactose-1-phosphate uridylyltransferase [Terriglobales bacterium]